MHGLLLLCGVQWVGCTAVQALHPLQRLLSADKLNKVGMQGLGIVWPTNIGVLEFNWCKILSAQQHDRQRTGLHFGLAIQSDFY